MLSLIVLDTLAEEDPSISGILKTAYAKRDLPIKRLEVCNTPEELLTSEPEILERCNTFIASFRTVSSEQIKLAQKIRKLRENLFIVFVADKKVDLSEYVRPSIRPSGILFIPLDKLRVYQTIREIYVEYLRLTEKEPQPLFTIKTGSEIYSVSCGDIYFFEARSKKIALKTAGQEIEFYSNFNTILERLPDWFIRCHKGFVVNARMITSASFNDMTLKLRDSSVIPFSRSYKEDVRGCLQT